MSHRLLEQYPSVYHLCLFNLYSFKETLCAVAAKDISDLKVREILERINVLYLSLTDQDIITFRITDKRKSLGYKKGVKLAEINKAQFVSIPTDLRNTAGQTLRLYMKRSDDAIKQRRSFRFYGMGTTLLPEFPETIVTDQLDLNNTPAPKKSFTNAPQGLLRHTMHGQLYDMQQNLDDLFGDAQNTLNHIRLLLHELDELQKAMEHTNSAEERRSLFERIKLHLRSIFGK